MPRITWEEISSLLSWLGWKYGGEYLKPNLDPSTTNLSIKVNSKIINNNGISSWKNYKNLLEPAIGIFNRSRFLNDLIK